MRIAAIIISIIIAVAIAATISVGLGVLIALACGAYQLIYEYGRSQTGSAKRTVKGAYMLDNVRNGVFLVPLAGALLGGSWYAALATVVVFGINLLMK